MTPRVIARRLPMNGRIDISLGHPAPDPVAASVPPLLIESRSNAPQPHAMVQAIRVAALVCGGVLLIRAVFLEPFGVPTGSMAPALIGDHLSHDCRNCGHSVAIGASGVSSQELRQFPVVRCPNCGKVLDLDTTTVVSGDRLLVDKLAFEWRGPRRWEPIVFRRSDDAEKPLVKRVVGLPGERVQIHDGDVLINGEVARKPLALCQAMQVPMIDMTCVPEQGWAAQWRADPLDLPDRTPWVDGSDLVLPVESATSMRWLALDRGQPFDDRWSYNATGIDPGNPVHDFVLTCEVLALRGRGEIALSLTDGANEATAVLPVGEAGQARILVGDSTFESRSVRLRTGVRSRVIFALVDRRVMFVVDGNEVMPPVDLAAVPVRPAVCRPLKVGAWGVSAVVSRVSLGHDIHYVSAGTHGVVNECLLGQNEYYVLGDNSAVSEDSRFWSSPTVSVKALIGKPLWLHDPARNKRGFDWSRFGRVR